MKDTARMLKAFEKAAERAAHAARKARRAPTAAEAAMWDSRAQDAWRAARKAARYLGWTPRPWLK